MTELTLIRAMARNEIKGALGVGIKMLLLTRKEISTNEIADFFDRDVKSITYAISGLKARGWLKRVGMATTYGLAKDSRTGDLRRVSINSGVYSATDKLKQLISEK